MSLSTDVIEENINNKDNEKTENKENKQNETRRAETMKFTKKYWIFCMVLILLVVVLRVVAVNMNSAYTTLSASFSQIYDGLNPDGSPFDIYEVLNDEVLSSACEKLENKVTPEILKKHISVTGITNDGTFNSIKQNVLDGEESYSYFPSRYTLTYSVISDSVKADGLSACVKAVFGQSSMPPKSEILESVAQSYKEYYDENYVVKNEIFHVDWKKTKSLDYFNRVNEMNNILNRISRYLSKRYDTDAKFVSTDGTSFGDLNAEALRIMGNDIKSFEAFVIENGITADKDKLLKQFKFVENENRVKTERSRGEYAIMSDGIVMYDPSVTKVVFIPSLDEDNNFYMNRTKVGIDYLIEKASEANLSGDATENKANYYAHLINIFQGAAGSNKRVLGTAERKCDEIIEKIDDFAQRASAVNDEYLSTVAYERIETSGISYGQGIVSSAVVVVKLTVICFAGFYALWVVFFTLKNRNKGGKESK